MRNWKPVDWVMVALTVTVCLAAILGAGASIFRPFTFESEEARVRFAAFMGAMLSIVSMWVGSKVGHKPPDDPPSDS